MSGFYQRWKDYVQDFHLFFLSVFTVQQLIKMKSVAINRKVVFFQKSPLINFNELM